MSKQYYDTQARIDALKTQQKRLLELLQQAKDMTDIIAIEQKLSDVNYQLDSFTADNRYIDDLVNFSTVNISLREVLKEQVINNAPKNIFEEIGQNFKKSMRDVANSARELVVTVIGNLPEILTALAVWAAVIFAGYRIYKAAKKRIFGKSASQPVKDGGDKTKE